MDEFWFPIRMADGMVDAVDRLSRTNRSVGVGTMKITHSPEDFLMLPNAHDQKTAHSMINKCGLWILLALGEGDITALSKVRKIKDTEAEWIKSFGAGAAGWNIKIGIKVQMVTPYMGVIRLITVWAKQSGRLRTLKASQCSHQRPRH